MTKTSLKLSLAALLALAVVPATVLAWGGSRGGGGESRSYSGGGESHSYSGSGSGREGGSYSHNSGTYEGPHGNDAHYGSSSYTSPSGKTYSDSHAGYGNSTTGWHGAYDTGSGGYGHYSSTPYNNNYHAAYGNYAAAPVAAAPVNTATPAIQTGPTVYPNSGYGGYGWGGTYAPPTSGVYVNNNNWYDTAPVVPQQPPPLAVGTVVASLPAGYTTQTVNGTQFYLSPPNWFTVQVTNGQIGFVVVPAPR